MGAVCVVNHMIGGRGPYLVTSPSRTPRRTYDRADAAPTHILGGTGRAHMWGTGGVVPGYRRI